MTVIQKYIEFLREYNKLLERGSKNVLRLKNTLWVEDIEDASIVVNNNLNALFLSDDNQNQSTLLLDVKRPLPKNERDDENEETITEKFDRESYSFLYQAARDTNKNSSLEFVYSFGLFHLKLGDAMVKTHLFHLPLKATIKGSSVNFKLHPIEDVYIDAFFLNHPQIDREQLLVFINKFEKAIEEFGIQFLKTKDFKNILTSDALALHPSLVYNPSHSKPADTLTTNFIAHAPCLVLRNKRPRHFQKLMDSIINFTSNNDVNPTVLDILLGQKSNLALGDTHYFSNIYESVKTKYTSLEPSDFEQFFPLPYNREQLDIYKNYKTHELSVVTGPPGTGKSHSIVNLLCAMLSEGKRILITAKTDKALESLLDKIPPQFGGLVMADIKQQNHSDYTLSNSIGNIRKLLLDNNEYNLDSDLEKLNNHKKHYLSQKAELAKILSQEYSKIESSYFERDFSVFGLYNFVEEKKVNWEFIKDTVNQDTLDNSDKIVKAIQRYIALLSVDKKHIDLDFKKVQEAIGLVDFETYNSLNEELNKKLNHLKTTNLNAFNSIEVESISKNLEPFKNKDLISNDKELLEAILLKESAVNQEVQDFEINKSAQEIKTDRAKYLRDVSTYIALLPKDKDKLSFIQKQINSIYKSVKYIDQISINDTFCNNKSTLIEFRLFLNTFSNLNEVIEILEKKNFIEFKLDEHCNLKKMQRVAIKGINKVKVNLEILNILEQDYLKDFIKNHEVSNNNIEAIVSKSTELLDVFEDAVKIQNQKLDLEIAIKETKKIVADIQITSFKTTQDLVATKQRLKSLEKAHRAYQEFYEVKQILKRFIPKTLNNPNSKPKAIRSSLHKDTFYLKDAAQKLEKATSIDMQKTNERLRHATEEIRNSKSDILSGLARENFKKRFSESEKNDFINLLSKFEYEFKQSKRGIADKEKFRRNAQKTAKAIAPNISCWVMKFDDVLKTVDTKPEVFDCIITDEASQLNFNSLLLGYYSKKMIIVGDEKQTSPEDIAITNEAFDSLRKNNLDFMGSDAINIRADASLFSLSNLVAGTTNQMLREHFRCVPELIDFSKKYFYENKLVPLKVISADRLLPKQRVFVKNAFLEDKVVEKEINAITQKLKELLEDPIYANKTIGVISLGLSKHTQKLKTIVEEFSIDKLEKHNIIVDNPSEFQGDERDVILISLGVASKVNEDNTLSAPTSIVDNIETNLTSKLRGINVGLSRAKEQMILFHSIALDQLKTRDFRRKIISFFDEKFSPVLPIELPINVEKKHRIPENRPKPFDSWFEYDIASALFDKGFQFIVPQYEIKEKELFYNPKLGKETYVHFLLDLVVYNNGTPVAIECDGDAFHSSVEDVAYDIERQEFLERIGWKIHRVIYSRFRIDPQGEIEKLVDFIQRNSPKNEELPVEKLENEIADVVADVLDDTDTVHEKAKILNIDSNNEIDNSEVFGELFSVKSDTPNLFSYQDEGKVRTNAKIVDVNTKCTIVMLDMQNKVEDVLLMDIPRNQQSKSRDGIQILSIYSDLGKLLMGSKEGEILKFTERNQRVKIDKVY